VVVSGEVRVEYHGTAAVIVIDRPSTHNAISRQTMQDLEDAVDEIAASNVRAVAVRGAGERVFVSGGDMKELASIRTPEEAQAMANRMRLLLDRLADLPVPVLGALNGHAFGGGCEVAVACDFRIAADDIRLAFNQVQLAIMPAWGGIERLQRLVGPARALWLMTTGRAITAAEAADWGLVEEVIPRADFDERLEAVLDGITRAPRAALSGIKAAARAASPASVPALADQATRSFAAVWVDEDHWTAVKAYEESRART
jgi:enoyl-CoA hydratase/carnithine racemase